MQHLFTFSQIIVPLLYCVLQVIISLALRIFCGNITVCNKAVLKSKGPLLLACNHPNSFLDAIIIGSLFKQPVHYLARGDAFKYSFTNKILRALNMLPVYRLSEGREYLYLNDQTFDSCHQILLQGGIVLIFCEGISKHVWQLQPLKKGTARIAFKAWSEPSISDGFGVLPVSINYHSFTKFGKQVVVHLGNIITKENVALQAQVGERTQQLNALLTKQLLGGMLVANGDANFVQALIAKHKQLIYSPATAVADLQFLQANYQLATLPKTNNYLLPKILLLIPAAIGFALHAALYFSVKKLVQYFTKDTVFYDSVLFGLLLILYPFYYVLVSVCAFCFTNTIALQIVVVLMPLWLWLLTSFKKLFH
ncbi:MAG: 1-acyl-sn-glycerol-3-phosphate acyltransferase [Flavobacterium sp.]|nr:1-acyl-sn-glycerol-3-phosphate acyltransferase [Flavobacterium sp.]